MLVPRAFLFPIVIVFCVVGAFAPDSQLSDVWIMLAFGAVGLAMEYARFPLAPFVVGFVLAPLAEGKLRSALMASDGSLWPLLTRPIAASLLAIAVVSCAWPAWRELRAARARAAR
jgi:putative tricarboxylic transport membrane protein